MLKTENVELEFTEDGIDAIANIASEVNATVENIGARRLHTIIEKILDEISFTATDRSGEKISINKTIDYKTALYDFNIGYITTVVLGICFISLGAFVMYNSGEKFSDQGGEFAGQLIDLYTSSIGENMFLIIAIAAFTTMFSTTITCLDASPRAMDKSFELLGFRKLSGYNFWLVILSAGTILIFIFFMSEMGSLVKIATILSFITAPIYAILNYTLVTSKFMPSNFHLSIKMKDYSIIGIIFLSSFSIWYITLI